MDRVIETYSNVLHKEPAEAQQPTPAAFWNYGYWGETTRDHAQASQALLEHLLTQLSPGTRTVLDVGFGTGESTRQLCQRFGEGNVVGINIAKDQVAAARCAGVHCELQVMDAARLQFPDERFDAIVCMEAAFHFRSRLDFLRAVNRVLKRGGRLVMSDVLFRSAHGIDPEVYPQVNFVSSPEEYPSLFGAAGFAPERVRFEWSTERQLIPFVLRLARDSGILRPPVAGGAERDNRVDHWPAWFAVTRLLNVSACVIVVAEKS